MKAEVKINILWIRNKKKINKIQNVKVTIIKKAQNNVKLKRTNERAYK